jgi:hypothetical protein
MKKMVAQLNQSVKNEKKNIIISFKEKVFELKHNKKEGWNMSSVISSMFEQMIINTDHKKTGLIDYYELNDKVYPLLDKKSEIDVLVFILKRTVLSRRTYEYITLDEMINGVKEGKEVYTVGTNLSANTIQSAVKVLISRNVIFKFEFSKKKDHLYIINTRLGKEIYKQLKSGKLQKEDIDQFNIDTRKRKLNYSSLYQLLTKQISNIDITNIKHCYYKCQTLIKVISNIDNSPIAETKTITKLPELQNPSTSVLPSVLPSVITNENDKKTDKPKSEKYKLFEKYLALRPNDSEYKNQLTEVVKETDLNVLQDWYDARPYIQTEKNIPYYVLNAIQNGKSLPSEFLRARNENLKALLFKKHSETYEKITNKKPVFSLIESNLGLITGEIVSSIKAFKDYLGDKSDKKFDENVIKVAKLHQNYLKTIISKVSLNSLEEMISDILNNNSIRKSHKKLSAIQDTEIQSLISSISTLSYQLDKQVGL